MLLTATWTCLAVHLPEDAEDHDRCDERYEGNAVADGVADLHLPEEFALTNKRSMQATKKLTDMKHGF